MGIRMITNCAPLAFVTRESSYHLSLQNLSNVIEVFNLTSWYVDDLLNIELIYFELTVNKMYPKEVPLNEIDYSVTGFIPGLNLSTSLIYDKIRDVSNEYP